MGVTMFHITSKSNFVQKHNHTNNNENMKFLLYGVGIESTGGFHPQGLAMRKVFPCLMECY